MKKTISINIKGLHFTIEEDAYETLQTYLNRLESKLGETEGKSEIIEDIELRIAELFSQELENLNKKVVELSDVQKAIEMLGEPEDYIDEETQKESSDTEEKVFEEEFNNRREKKLFRDLENANIAGVCSGLSIYFNIDVIIVRALFLVIFLFAGFGLPLYVILWIVLPKVNNNIDRLRMQGRPITVENVRDEVEAAAQRMTDKGEKFARKLQRENSIQQRFSSLGRLVRILVGLVALFYGIASLIAFATLVVFDLGVLPISGNHGLYSLYEFSSLLWETEGQLQMLWLLGSICSVVLISWLIAVGCKFIFNLNFNWMKHLNRLAMFTVIFSVIAGFYFGVTLAREFSFESEIVREINPEITDLAVEIKNQETYNSTNGSILKITNNHPFWLQENEGLITEGGLRIRHVVSPDSLFHIRVITSAHGFNQDRAEKNAKDIVYNLSLDSNRLSIPREFTYHAANKIRGQRVRMIIEIPRGKQLKYKHRTIDLNHQFDYEEYDESIQDIWIRDNGDIRY